MSRYSSEKIVPETKINALDPCETRENLRTVTKLPNTKHMKARTFLIALLISILTTHSGLPAQRLPLAKVDPDMFVTDTQGSPKGVGDDHITMTWWIPKEFWSSILSRDNTTSEKDKETILSAVSGVSLIAIAQGDVSSLGTIKFYSKEEIEKGMSLTFSGPDGKLKKLAQAEKINPDLEVVIGMFKPILGAAIGNFGNNMHFFVLNDSTDSGRILDPYEKGQVNIQLAKRNGDLVSDSLDLPVNALFVPRKCPNGKDADISWEFCPWTGAALEE